MNFYKGYKGFISNYIKDMEAKGYDWQATFDAIQQLGYQYFYELLSSMYDTEAEDYAGGFIAHPNTYKTSAGHIILKNDTLVLTKSKKLAVLKGGTDLNDPSIPKPPEETALYCSDSIGETDSLGYTKHGQEIVRNIPYINKLSYNNGDTLLWTINNGIYIPNVLMHRIPMEYSLSSSYVGLLTRANNQALQLNSNLHTLHNMYANRSMYFEGGFYSGQDLKSAFNVTCAENSSTGIWTSEFTINAGADLKYWFNGNNGHTLIHINPTSDIVLSTVVDPPPVDASPWRYYIYDVIINVSDFNDSQIKMTDATYLGIGEAMNTPEPYSDMPDMIHFTHNNRLGSVLITSSGTAYFIPKYIGNPNLLQRTYILPPYYSDVVTAGDGRQLQRILYADSNMSTDLPLYMDGAYRPVYINAIKFQDFGNDLYIDSIFSNKKTCSSMEAYNVSYAGACVGISEMATYSVNTNMTPYNETSWGGDAIGIYDRFSQPFYLRKSYSTYGGGSMEWYLNTQLAMDALFNTPGAPYHNLRNKYEIGQSGPYMINIYWARGGIDYIGGNHA